MELHNIFNVLKTSLPDMQTVAASYGLAISHNKAMCPFHADKHPSMTFKNKHFTCWACGAHGDAIDFLQNLFGLKAIDAAKKLNADFALGLDFAAGKGTPAAQAEWRRKQAETLAYVEWESERYNALRDAFRALRSWRTEYAPQNPTEPMHPCFVASLRGLDAAEYALQAWHELKAADKQNLYYKETRAQKNDENKNNSAA